MSVGWGLRPIYDFIDLDYTKQVKAIKSTMWVEFNRPRHKFVVKDKDNEGMTYIYMVVQEPNGDFRDFDNRVIETLRHDVWRGPEPQKILTDLELIEKNRWIRVDAEAADIEYGINTDCKWAGTDVVTPVVWDHRGLVYEEKVKEKARVQSSSMREAIRDYARS